MTNFASTDSQLWDRWRQVAPDSTVGQDIWIDLVTRWSEPHRAYHNLNHLLQVLQVIDALTDPAVTTSLALTDESLWQVRAAAWFHDVVYEPAASDNEARSADHAARQLLRIGAQEAQIATVRALIFMTIDHHVTDLDPAAVILHDADLSILGQSAAQYLDYVNGVREEYSQIADEAFRIGRSTILTGFLNREQIYLGSDANRRFEARARINIQAELAIYSDGDEVGNGNDDGDDN
ncbi:MAG: hypothetical protein ABI137_06025 [Antricoccus sp.]